VGPKVGRALGDVTRIRGQLSGRQPVARGEQRRSSASTEKQGTLAWVMGQLMARLGRLWALRKKGKRETCWAVHGKEKGHLLGHFGGEKEI
jgi:hypothetical protein